MSFGLAVVVAALSGFISLSYEILWYRAYSFVSGGAPATFGLLLGFYLGGLAAGAFASRVLCDDRRHVSEGVRLGVLAACVFLANVIGFLVVPALGWMVPFKHWAKTLPVVAVSAAMFGAVLPLISHFGIHPNRLAGARLSYLYLANIVGSAAGSLLTGFVLMDVWPLRTISVLLALLGFCLTGVLVLHAGWRSSSLAVAGGAFAVAVALVVLGAPTLFDRLYERLLYKGTFTRDTRLADVLENRHGVVTITSKGETFGGGVYDGVISIDLVNDVNWIFRAYGVAALHPAPREVLMIGLSTGAWAQVLANMPGVEHLTVVEINPGYLTLIQKHSVVASILTNPKVEIVIDDGRRWLKRSGGRRFDVIVANTTFHWRAHATNLLSREYLGLIRQHLRPGGVYHFNTTFSLEAMKTALGEFPFGLRFSSFVTVSASPLTFDSERLRQVLVEYRIDGKPVLDLARPAHQARLEELVRLKEGLSGVSTRRDRLESREGVLARAAGRKIVTDDNMATEWHEIFVRPEPPS